MIKAPLTNEFRFPTFRRVDPKLYVKWPSTLAFGLFCTLLAGVGRYWDNPKAQIWQKFGLGSLAYVFVLSLIVWMLIAPLRPKNWLYHNVLLFIALTSPLAILYAIPVEKFLQANIAREVNA